MNSTSANGNIRTLQTLLTRRLGLTFEDSQFDRLAGVLDTRVRETKSAHAACYLRRLESGELGDEELGQLADQLTVGETYFFRHPEQLRAFAEVALLERLKAHTPSNPVRILSAGCASGEEPYSLAILVCEALGHIPAKQVQISAFDVSPMMVEKARRARYSEWSLRATSPERKQTYFRREDRDYVLNDAVRSMVTVDVGNLLDEDGPLKRGAGFDIIFFRNVGIYFSPQAHKSAIVALTRSIVSGGYLFLGPTETLRGLSSRFHLRHTHLAFYYQLIIEGGRDIGPPHGTIRRPPLNAIAPAADWDTSWMGRIRGAAERISSLSEKRSLEAEPLCRIMPATDQARQPGSQLERARALLFEERFDAALIHLQGAGENAESLLLHAVLSVNKGEIEQAEDLCKRLLRLDELNAGAHYLLALCREHVSDRSGSAEHDLVAIYLDPGFAMPHLHLGMVTKRSGDLTTAEHEFREAVTLLEREDPARILLFGGGFSRDALIALCRAELESCGGTP